MFAMDNRIEWRAPNWLSFRGKAKQTVGQLASPRETFPAPKLNGNLCAGVSDTPLPLPSPSPTHSPLRRALLAHFRSFPIPPNGRLPAAEEPPITNYEMHPRTDFGLASGFPLRSDYVDTFSLAGELFTAGAKKRARLSGCCATMNHSSLTARLGARPL